MPLPSSSARRTVILTTCAGILLAGCAGAPVPPAAGSPEPSVAAASASDGVAEPAAYPVTIDNCGVEVTLDAPPERVLTIKSSTVEMMLSLGLADRVAGAAFLDGPVPAELADDARGIEIVSERVPGPEAVLAREPDLVYAGWESNFSAEGAGDRSALADLGVATYVSPAACKADGYQPDPLTFEDVFAEITEAGRVFGVPQAAADLVDQQAAELAAIDSRPRDVTALWYSSGSDTPYVGAGIGAPQMIMDAIGVTNIAADVHDTWTSLGWEEVVDADPDVIILVDAAWNTAQNKIEVLTANPATAKMAAVIEGRYLVVPFAATEAGVRNVSAARELAAQLDELGPLP